MCIVIDTNVLASVFNQEAQDHNEFSPVLDWIIYGKGKIVFGGSKYREELRKTPKYIKIIGQFTRGRKTVVIDDDKVDEYQKSLEEQLEHRDFDDPHLVAICFISRCRLICTKEKRAIPFLAKKEFYPNNCPRPKLYTKKSNCDLLCDKYIAEICNPCVKLNKNDAEILNKTTANKHSHE